MNIFAGIGLDEAERHRPWNTYITGFDAGDLPLTAPKRRGHLFANDQAAVHVLPEPVKGFRYSIPLRLCDKVEPSSHGTDSDDATSSRASDPGNEQSTREQNLLVLLERSAAVKSDLRQLRSFSDSDRDLVEVVSRIDRLLLDYDESAARKCTPGPGSQSAGTNRSNGESNRSPSQGHGFQGHRPAKRQRIAKQNASAQFPNGNDCDEGSDNGGGRQIYCILHSFDPDKKDPCNFRFKHIRDLM